VGLFFYTWKWLKNKKQLLKSGCLALWGIAYFSLVFFFVSYFYFLQWDMRPKKGVMNPKISISIRKKKPVGTLYIEIPKSDISFTCQKIKKSTNPTNTFESFLGAANNKKHTTVPIQQLIDDGSLAAIEASLECSSFACARPQSRLKHYNQWLTQQQKCIAGR
jgi:hypothetical protein